MPAFWQRELRFAYLAEPPFCYRDPSGRVTGCDVELARSLHASLGGDAFQPVATEFDQLLPGLAAGLWHMTTGLFVTPARAGRARFSRPIWALPDGLLVRAGEAAPDCYRALASQPGALLAVVADQVQAETARRLGVPATRLRVYRSYTEAAAAVAAGEVAAFASVALAHRGHLERHPGAGLAVETVPAGEQPPAAGAFAFAPGAADCALAFDAALARFLGSAEHRALMRGFGFAEADVDLALALGRG